MHPKNGKTFFKLTILVFFLVFLFNSLPIVIAEQWNTQTQVTNIKSLFPCYPVISGDGSKIVFQAAPENGIFNSSGYGIYVINSDGSRLAGPIAVGNQPRINDDGSKIVFFAFADGLNTDVYIINSDASRSYELSWEFHGMNVQPCISGDGRKVAWTHGGEPALDTDIMFAFSDGSLTYPITNTAGINEGYPSMDNTGDKIAYQVQKENNTFEIFVWSKDTGSTYVTNGAFPSISGDGKKIAFVNTDGKIYVVNSDGSGLIGPIASGYYPCINFDGTVVAFVYGTISRDVKVFCVNSDGNNLKQISDAIDLETVEPPSISDDGKTVAFAKHFGTYSTQEEVFLVNVDLRPPVTSNDYDNKLHNSDFQIALTAKDDLSGVANIYYKINDGSTKTVSEDGEPTISKENLNNTLEYWSIDNAGNEENHNFLLQIKLDRSPPLDVLPYILVAVVGACVFAAIFFFKIHRTNGKSNKANKSTYANKELEIMNEREIVALREITQQIDDILPTIKKMQEVTNVFGIEEILVTNLYSQAYDIKDKILTSIKALSEIEKCKGTMDESPMDSLNYDKYWITIRKKVTEFQDKLLPAYTRVVDELLNKKSQIQTEADNKRTKGEKVPSNEQVQKNLTTATKEAEEAKTMKSQQKDIYDSAADFIKDAKPYVQKIVGVAKIVLGCLGFVL